MTLETKILLTVGVPSFLQTVRASYLTGTSCVHTLPLHRENVLSKISTLNCVLCGSNTDKLNLTRLSDL